MNRTGRVLLIKLALVVVAASLGAVAATIAAGALGNLLGERSVFTSDDTIPLAGMVGAILGGSLATTGWGSLRYAPLRAVLAGTSLGALSGGILAGAVGGALARDYELTGALTGSIVGFATAVARLKRKYPPPTVATGPESTVDAV